MPDSNLTNTQRSFTRTPIAAGVVLAIASPALLAQQSEGIEEITVTAQKRAENLQDVPISIQALGGEALEELNAMNFMDYTKMLPSVATEMNGTSGAGTSFSLVYMRGIATACTMFRASKRWRARRARCTAPVLRPARFALLRTSRI
jgi:outer membrane receptor protein involved in Fe transport